MSDLKLLVNEYERARGRGEPVLVATVVEIQGSSYRRIGARMIVSGDRWIAGSVSGGCLEGDVVRRGAHRLRHGAAVVVTYDSTSDDEVGWGLGLGCNGIVRILLECIDDSTIADPLRFAGDCIAREERGAILTVFESDDAQVAVGSRILVCDEAPTVSTLGESQLREPFERVAREALSSQQHASRASVQSIGGVKVLVEVIDPAPTLFVCGSNHDAVPITKLARDLGWRTVVATPSASAATNDRFAGVDQILAGPAEILRNEVARCARACAVVMSHDYERDRDVLGVLLESKLKYVGILGPRKRTDRMLSELGRPEAIALDFMHAPIGLDLGAETPQEIALSIVAEIQATLAGARVQRLKDKSGSIHRVESVEKNSAFVVGAVLAAGSSQRLGRAKQLETFRNKRLVRHVVDELCASSCKQSTVILGANAERIEAVIATSSATSIYNEQWSEGLASSIRKAVQWAKEQEAGALVLLLGDQPLIERRYVETLVDAWKKGAPAAGSFYDGVLGPPAIFDAKLFDALLELRGDRGASKLLRTYPGVVSISWSQGIVDVDTEADVNNLREYRIDLEGTGE